MFTWPPVSSWLLQTCVMLAGIALTWFQPKTSKSQSSQNNPDTPESWN